MKPQCVILTDAESQSEAHVLVGYGFNCFRFVARQGADAYDLIWAVDGFESGEHRASSSGIPILFPFPGRIAEGVFEWRGVTYQLEAGDGRGNAIHGFVHTRPWRVTHQSANSVTAEFQASVDDPSLSEKWPSDFKIVGTYRLNGTCLESEFTCSNPGSSDLPCGLGTHPYFRVPIVSKSAALQTDTSAQSERCQLKLPVSKAWTLTDMLPTGECQPLPDALELQQGFTLEDREFDTVYGGLVSRNGVGYAEVSDPVTNRRLEVRWTGPVRECVVYTPGHREAVCIEPYTCVPDAARLADRDIDAGLQVLSPGESFTVAVAMELYAEV